MELLFGRIECEWTTFVRFLRDSPGGTQLICEKEDRRSYFLSQLGLCIRSMSSFDRFIVVGLLAMTVASKGLHLSYVV